MRKSVFGMVITLTPSLVSLGFAEPIDPLLKLLVAKGVISLDEAAVLQEEYDQMKKSPASDTAETPAVTARVQDAGQGSVSSTAAAPAVAPVPEKTRWSNHIKLGGDFRLRAENTHEKGAFDDGDRLRFRYRLRLGLEAGISEHLRFSMQMRSGNPDNPVSDNQSFDGGLNKKQFSIAQANLQWKASSSFDFWAGKKNPKKDWVVSDMEWDSDVVAEGVMARGHLKSSGGASLDLVAYQNFGARGAGEDADTAYFGRISVGGHTHPKELQLRYTYYYSEADALFYAYTQSDTRRSSNLKGHRFDLRLGGPKKSYFSLNWYNTRKQQGESETMNRFQLDYVVKF